MAKVALLVAVVGLAAAAAPTAMAASLRAGALPWDLVPNPDTANSAASASPAAVTSTASSRRARSSAPRATTRARTASAAPAAA
eukprot:CAMPEP_0203817658 /NCGR_PEP_ID=MMETSP0115-20131106/27405_1 /ASSEMBLY_ACC=CAM_ASM_000227 /TAXON_ID=33651 /ORGANISM="Bicosoecid sp, Strain ms1" /LENGTH=83 /DNA_ID=CAMNT_0050726599 /DNA_START=43 /DNA_END=291 /DNA_ORIENTATION=+